MCGWGHALGDVVGVLRGWVDRVQGPAYGVSTAELMGDVCVSQQILAAAGAAQTMRIAQFAAKLSADLPVTMRALTGGGLPMCPTSLTQTS